MMCYVDAVEQEIIDYQAAAFAAWSAIHCDCPDYSAITTKWSDVLPRETDGKFYAPVYDQCLDPALTEEEFNSNWLPA